MAKNTDALSLVRPHLRTLEAYEAVESPEVMAERAGVPVSRIVKLNGNENPYGPSPKVRDALANLDRVHIYPDARQTAMRQVIGGYVGIGPEHVVVGNGSDEIIDLLLRAFLAPGDAIINCTPTFGMYTFTAHVCGGTTVTVPRDDSFQVDVPGVLRAANEGGSSGRAKVLVIASPNNPTGRSTSLADVKRCLDAGLVVIVDEAYSEFGGESAVPLVPTNPGLIVLRTLSKWAGLAGLRVGYGLMVPELAELLLRFKPPYNVSQAAESALLASFEDLDMLMERVRWLIAERERMHGLLSRVPGVESRPAEGNFILCRMPPGRAKAVYEGLARRGVFVRYFGQPRLEDFLRISVGTPEQTDRLMEALTEALGD
jgi:histidinol-phosphate aminotransferase